MLKNGCILQVKGIVIKISVKLSKLWSVRRGELKVLCQYSATTELQKIIMRREFCTISKLLMPLNFSLDTLVAVEDSKLLPAQAHSLIG